MSLTGIKAALVTALKTISGLTVYDHVPESINEKPPVAWVMPRSGEYNLDPGGNMYQLFEVVLLVQRMGDLDQAQTDLDTYLDNSGTYSIKAALDAASLSTHAHDLLVERWRDYGVMEYPPGSGTQYLGFKVDVRVLA